MAHRKKLFEKIVSQTEFHVSKQVSGQSGKCKYLSIVTAIIIIYFALGVKASHQREDIIQAATRSSAHGVPQGWVLSAKKITNEVVREFRIICETRRTRPCEQIVQGIKKWGDFRFHK